MPARRGQRPTGSAGRLNYGPRAAAWITILAAALLPASALVPMASAVGSGQLRATAAALQRFLLFYSGVFALVALTAAVGAGLLAADRIVMSPGRRVVTQAVHRALSLLAVAALGNHVTLEVLARRAHAADALVPFRAGRHTAYMGLGTIAADLLVLVLLTGVVRGRFAAGARPWAWRGLHATAYAAWPMAILHGLLAGRPARPYVGWSYGACLAVVGMALTIRYATIMHGRAVAAGPPPGQVSGPTPAPAAIAAGVLGDLGPPARLRVDWPARRAAAAAPLPPDARRAARAPAAGAAGNRGLAGPRATGRRGSGRPDQEDE